MNQKHADQNRRNFLFAASCVLGAAVTAPGICQTSRLTTAIANANLMNSHQRDTRVIVFQDQALFDSSGVLPPYLPPVDPGAANRRYLETVDEATFLARHWFV